MPVSSEELSVVEEHIFRGELELAQTAAERLLVRLANYGWGQMGLDWDIAVLLLRIATTPVELLVKGDVIDHPSLLRIKGIQADLAGNTAEAIRLFQRAFKQAKSIGRRDIVMRVYNNLLKQYRYSGDYKELNYCYDYGHVFAIDLDEKQTIAYLNSNFIEFLFDVGRIKDLEDLYYETRRICDVLDRQGQPNIIASSRIAYVWGKLNIPRMSKAPLIAMLMRAVHAADTARYSIGKVGLLYCRALVHAHHHEYEQSLQLLKDVQNMARDAGEARLRPMSWSKMGEILTKTGEVDEAEELLLQALNEFEHSTTHIIEYKYCQLRLAKLFQLTKRRDLARLCTAEVGKFLRANQFGDASPLVMMHNEVMEWY
jgi:tetratricopeptide (TPR) repeat protein